MNSSIDDGVMKEILRPKINPLRGSGRTVSNYVLTIGVGSIILGLILRNPRLVFFPLIVLPIFPGIPLLFGLFWHCTLSIIVYDKKLVIKDYSFNCWLKVKTQQEIVFDDIDYIYYLGKEYNLLKNYRHKLRKYQISTKEVDYRKENLIHKYAIPNEVIEAFEHSSQKTLNDYTATGVLLAIDAMADKYKIPKNVKKRLIKDLKRTDDFDFKHLRSLLSPYAIRSEDIDSLEDEFSDCDVNNLMPFLLTKLKVATAEKKEDGRGGVAIAVSINTTLVLSNEGGTKKVYIKQFHSLSRSDWQKLIRIINEKKSNIKYLMANQNYRNISDPNFKPGRG